MQVFYYTDASITEDKQYIAIEIKNGKENQFFRFSNINIVDKPNDSNALEQLGILFSIALNYQLGFERPFIFNDNISAIQKMQKLYFNRNELFSEIPNIQFAWLQNDMPEMKKVDFISRNYFKKEKDFDLEQIEYKELCFNETICFKMNEFDKYLENRCIELRAVLGFTPTKHDMSYIVHNRFCEYDNNKTNRIEIINELNENRFVNKIIAETDNIEKNVINREYSEKKIKISATGNDFFVENKIIIKNDDMMFEIIKENKIYKLEEVVNDKRLLQKIINRKKIPIELKEENIIIKSIQTPLIKIKTWNEIISKIEKNQKIGTILNYIKVFDKEKFNFICDNSKTIKKRSYRRSVNNLVNLYNLSGFLK